MNEVRAELVRQSTLQYIEVHSPSFRGGNLSMHNGTLADINYYAKNFSPNELRKILLDCEMQLQKLGPENTPFVFREIVNKLREAMIKRGISLEPPIPSITIVIGPGPRTRRLIMAIKKFCASTKEKVTSLLKRAGIVLKIIETREIKDF